LGFFVCKCGGVKMARKKEVVEEYVDSVDDSFIETTNESHDAVVEDSKEEKVSSKELYLENLRKAKELSNKAKTDFKKSEYKMLRNDCYMSMDTVTSMVKKGVAISGIIYSKGGLGKTFRMKQLLKDVEYEVIMTKLTPKAFCCMSIGIVILFGLMMLLRL
jgi:hypothetical protein